MAFVALGCLLVVLKLFELGPVGAWSWWWILSPFVAAVIWWAIADATGQTQRRAVERDQKRIEARRKRHLKAMGLDLLDRKPPRRPGA